MRAFMFTLLLAVSLSAAASAAPADPLHSAKQVMAELYKQANIKPADVNIEVMKFDHLEGMWHIELTPKKTPCIDCYPAYYFKNQKKLILKQVKHG